MKTKIIFSLLLICSAILNAQSPFVKGYVVTLQNDTLTGLLHRDGLHARTNACTYRADSVSESVIYTANDLKGYGYSGSKCFRSKTLIINEKPVTRFTECLLDGAISLYLVQGADFDDRYLAEMDTNSYELNNDMVSYTQNGTHYQKHSEQYKGTLKFITRQVPSLRSQIETTNFRPAALVKVCKEYHTATAANTPMKEYYGQVEKVKNHWELQFGVLGGAGISKVAMKDGLKYVGTDIEILGDGRYTAEFYGSDHYSGFGRTSYSGQSNLILPGISLAMEQGNVQAIQLEVWVSRQQFTMGTNPLEFTALSVPVLYRRNFLPAQKLRPYLTVGLQTHVYTQVSLLDSIRVDYGAPALGLYNEVDYTEKDLYEKRPGNETGTVFSLGAAAGIGARYEIHRNGFLQLECRTNLAYWKGSHTLQNEIYSEFVWLHYGFQVQLSYVVGLEL